MTYYLDGAHTPESVAACAEWFLSQMDTSHKSVLPLRNCYIQSPFPSRQDTLRVLLFNTTGKRDTRTLLLPLMVWTSVALVAEVRLCRLQECGFSRFVFCPNISHSEDTQNSPGQGRQAPPLSI